MQSSCSAHRPCTQHAMPHRPVCAQHSINATDRLCALYVCDTGMNDVYIDPNLPWARDGANRLLGEYKRRNLPPYYGFASECGPHSKRMEASRRQREINGTSVKKAITALENSLELSVFKKPVPSTHGQKRHEPAPGYKQPTLFERLLWKLFRKPLSAGRPTTLAE